MTDIFDARIFDPVIFDCGAARGGYRSLFGFWFGGFCSTPRPDFEILGGGAAAYRPFKPRDIIQEILDQREAVERAEYEAEKNKSDLKAAKEQDILTANDLRRKEKQLQLAEAELLALQNHLQALVAMKKRIDADNEDALIVLSMSVPFMTLKT